MFYVKPYTATCCLDFPFTKTEIMMQYTSITVLFNIYRCMFYYNNLVSGDCLSQYNWYQYLISTSLISTFPLIKGWQLMLYNRVIAFSENIKLSYISLWLNDNPSNLLYKVFEKFKNTCNY